MGATAVEALGMSVFVFAGAAQLAAVHLLSAGASVAIILLTVFVVNLRLTFYSASLAPHFKGLLAGLAAVLIAWRTRSVPLTLVGGMATLWALQALGLAP